mgnify:CR=1 FL=1
MYTGIVQSKAEIGRIDKQKGLWTFFVAINEAQRQNIAHGMSVSLDGVCMTVVREEEGLVVFDAMTETLEKTTLGTKRAGDFVNIERSAKAGDEIGGHTMSGHVYTMATLSDLNKPENNAVLTFTLQNTEAMKYIFHKGFIGVNGCSLTVVDPTPEGTFSVYLIPETLDITTFGDMKVGDYVNIELDPMTQVVVETVERVMKDRNKI